MGRIPRHEIRVNVEVANHASSEAMDTLLRLTGNAPTPDLAVLIGLAMLINEGQMMQDMLRKKEPAFAFILDGMLAALTERRKEFVDGYQR